jgi:hypothetical protein
VRLPAPGRRPTETVTWTFRTHAPRERAGLMPGWPLPRPLARPVRGGRRP